MMATYLDRLVGRPFINRDPKEIKNEINTGQGRPSNTYNSHANMKWWLERQFPGIEFRYDDTTDVLTAHQKICASIDHGFPVMVSTNHSLTGGHIVVVVGYGTRDGGFHIRGPVPANSNAIFACHDPFGRFNPADSAIRVYGKDRWKSGMTLIDPSDGEFGPGKFVTYDIEGIRRIRNDQHSQNHFFLLRPLRLNSPGGR